MESKLVPQSIDVTVDGETITLQPFGFGQLPRVAAKLSTLYSLFDGAKDGQAFSLADVIEAGGDGLMDVICMAAGKPREWLDGLQDVEAGTRLVKAVWELNAKKLMPLLLGVLGQMEAQMAAAAGTASPSTTSSAS